MRKSFKRKQKKAFTLIEVMLAVGVVAVSLAAMIGLLAAITSNISQIRYQNKAVSLLANIETTLKMQSFDTVFKWVSDPSNPHVMYFWDEYQNPDDPDNSSMVTKSSELEGSTSGVPPTTEQLNRSEGEVFRVILSLYQNGLKGQRTRIGDDTEYVSGPLGDVDNYALSYLPLKVEILAEPRDNIVSGAGDENTNQQRRVYEEILVKLR